MFYIFTKSGRFVTRLGQIVADQRGVTAVLTAISATGMLGIAGLAVDVGYWQMQQRSIQGAAEQAAYAASYFGGRLSGSSDNAKKQARAVAAALGFTDSNSCSSSTPTTAHPTVVCVNNPPATGSSTTDNNAYEVIINQVQPTWLSKVVLSTAPTASGRAVAKAQTTATGTMALANSDCKGALPLPTDCDVSNAFYVNGSTPVNFSGASIISNSSSGSAISVQTGSLVVGLNAYASGTDSVGNNGAMTVNGANMQTTPPIPDPYLNRTAPTVGSCGSNPTSSSGGGSNNKYQPNSSVTIYPGVYCGGIGVGNGLTVTMSPGVYILVGTGNGNPTNGNFDVGSGSTVNATGGVTVYMTGSGTNYGLLNVGSNSFVNITAPTSGTNKGMAIWVDRTAPTNSTNVGFSSGTTVNIQGVLYAPSQNLTWSGNSGTSATCTQVIAKTLTFTGGGTFGHTCTGAGISEAIVNATMAE